MTQYRFIKSKLQIAEELHNLWDNYPLYKFINGAQWVRKRELDICECLTEKEREDWIEICRVVWSQKEQEKVKTKKKP
jgi:hypothetical protein